MIKKINQFLTASNVYYISSLLISHGIKQKDKSVLDVILVLHQDVLADKPCSEAY